MLFSCSIINKDFIVKHKTKTLRLKGLTDTIKIGYETKSAILYFGLEDTKNKLEEIKRRTKRSNNGIYYNDLKKIINCIDTIKQDLIIKDFWIQDSTTNILSYTLSGFFNQHLIKDLIFKKKCKVLNKQTKCYETKIYFHYVRDRMGSESEYYKFKNGTEILNQTISFGE